MSLLTVDISVCVCVCVQFVNHHVYVPVLKCLLSPYILSTYLSGPAPHMHTQPAVGFLLLRLEHVRQ